MPRADTQCHYARDAGAFEDADTIEPPQAGECQADGGGEDVVEARIRAPPDDGEGVDQQDQIGRTVGMEVIGVQALAAQRGRPVD